MSLNATPTSERIHIGFFGRRNAGKSSVMNAVTGQDLAIVSEQKGTTTDPVYKTMELLPLGPVVMIDTPGLDDEGSLGELRVKKAYQVLNKIDMAIMVIDGREGAAKEDLDLLLRIRQKNIPYLIVFNKEDLFSGLSLGEFKERKEQAEELLLTLEEAGERLRGETAEKAEGQPSREASEKAERQMSREASEKAEGQPKERQNQEIGDRMMWISAGEKTGIEALKERIARLINQDKDSRRIVGDIICPGNLIILVVPIDKAAPKGRLILPQQQTIRDILDTGAAAVVVRDSEYKETLEKLGRAPDLVITDSQAFAKVSAETPLEVPLTSFSILFARYKGILFPAVQGARAVEGLRDGDKVLLSEGCTHHRQCGDIGTVKLPAWIGAHTGKTLEFCFTSGTEFPEDLREYRLIVHCGGCMLNAREMLYRLHCAQDQNIPMTNYGTLIAYMQGILERSISIFNL